MAQNTRKTQTFESALERIEQIAAQMETAELPLEQLIITYEEGLRLVRYCSERLAEAEKRLETITRDSAGHIQGIGPAPEPVETASTPPKNTGIKEDSGGSGEETTPARLF